MKKFEKKKYYNKFIKKYYYKITSFNYAEYFKYQHIKILVAVIIIFFSCILYLSLPAFYNYESFDKELQNKIHKDFKVNLRNIKGIKYSFIPKPHFIIETSNLFLAMKNEKEIAKINNLKVFLSLSNLHNKEQIKIKLIKIKEANFYINDINLKSFYKHLHTNITKPIYINNSNFFYSDRNDEVTTISPINKFKYFIDIKRKEKILKISGKLFDVNYKYKWKKDYLFPKISESNVNFKSPNIKIMNRAEKDNKNDLFKGFTEVKFLNNELNIFYSFDKNKIDINSEKRKLDFNDKIKLKGHIELNPFFFDLNLSLLELDFNLITQKLFLFVYSLNSSVHPYFNGNFSIKLNKLNNKLFKDIVFNFKFEEEQIKLDRSNLNLKKIGKINFSSLEYIEKGNKLLVKTRMELDVNDQDEFYKRFQISKKKRIDLKKIYFDIEKDVDENIYFISNIIFNSDDKSKKQNKIVSELETHKINNIQQLTRIIKERFKQIN